MNIRRPQSPPNVTRYDAMKDTIYGDLQRTVYLPARELWQDKNPEARCIRLVRRFLQEYIWSKKWKRQTGCGYMEMYSPVYDIVNLIFLCLEFKVEDSRLIADLVTALHSVEENHATIWLGIGCKFMQEHWESVVQLFSIAHWRLQNHPDYHLLVLEYLVRHAVKAGLTHDLTVHRMDDEETRQIVLAFLDFPIYGSSRFAEESQPVIFYIKRGMPKELRLLLKYGANVPPESISNIRSTDLVLDVTLGVAFCIQILPAFLSEMKSRMVECSMIMLADIPYYSVLRTRMLEILLLWFAKEEELELGSHFPTLMEISRFYIRRALKQNRALPDGINELPLLPSLAQFVALNRLGPKGLHFRSVKDDFRGSLSTAASNQ